MSTIRLGRSVRNLFLLACNKNMFAGDVANALNSLHTKNQYLTMTEKRCREMIISEVRACTCIIMNFTKTYTYYCYKHKMA